MGAKYRRPSKAGWLIVKRRECILFPIPFAIINRGAHMAILKTFDAIIKSRSKKQVEIRIEAENQQKAKMLLKARYGNVSIMRLVPAH